MTICECIECGTMMDDDYGHKSLGTPTGFCSQWCADFHKKHSDVTERTQRRLEAATSVDEAVAAIVAYLNGWPEDGREEQARFFAKVIARGDWSLPSEGESVERGEHEGEGP